MENSPDTHCPDVTQDIQDMKEFILANFLSNSPVFGMSVVTSLMTLFDIIEVGPLLFHISTSPHHEPQSRKPLHMLDAQHLRTLLAVWEELAQLILSKIGIWV